MDRQISACIITAEWSRNYCVWGAGVELYLEATTSQLAATSLGTSNSATFSHRMTLGYYRRNDFDPV